MASRDPSSDDIEDWTDYGDPEWVPLGPKLSSYFLHTVEWREAFLERLVAVGEIAVIEAASRVYDLLNEPKDFRCALIAQAAGVTGSGKIAVVNALQAYLDEWLQPIPSLPAASSFDDLEGWHSAAMATWASERNREQWVVKKFAAALDGQALTKPSALPSSIPAGVVLSGPWSPVSLQYASIRPESRPPTPCGP